MVNENSKLAKRVKELQNSLKEAEKRMSKLVQKRNEPLENLQTQLEEITASLSEEKNERLNLEKNYKDL